MTRTEVQVARNRTLREKWLSSIRESFQSTVAPNATMFSRVKEATLERENPFRLLAAVSMDLRTALGTLLAHLRDICTLTPAGSHPLERLVNTPAAGWHAMHKSLSVAGRGASSSSFDEIFSIVRISSSTIRGEEEGKKRKKGKKKETKTRLGAKMEKQRQKSAESG